LFSCEFACAFVSPRPRRRILRMKKIVTGGTVCRGGARCYDLFSPIGRLSPSIARRSYLDCLFPDSARGLRGRCDAQSWTLIDETVSFLISRVLLPAPKSSRPPASPTSYNTATPPYTAVKRRASGRRTRRCTRAHTRHRPP